MEEREFWDRFAKKLKINSTEILKEISFYEKECIKQLGELKNKTLLDCGIGIGKITTIFKDLNANVLGIDISYEMLKLAKKNGLQVYQMELENLGFKSEVFDLIFGEHILHHTQIKKSIKEIYRVIKKGGKCVFIETFGLNPILNFARKNLVGRFGIPKYGTKTEHPITTKDLKLIRNLFSKVKIYTPEVVFFRLFAGYKFNFKSKIINNICKYLDIWMYKNNLRYLSYHHILVFEKV